MISDLIKIHLDRAIKNIHTITIGQILEYDPLEMRASVKLLENIEFNGIYIEPPVLNDCLVKYEQFGSFVIRTPYEDDDYVVVGFSESALDAMVQSGQSENQELTRRHAEDDCIILGAWRPDSNPKFEDEDKDGYSILNQDKKSKILLQKDGEFFVTNEKASLNVKMDGGIDFKNDGSEFSISDVGDLDFVSGSTELSVTNAGVLTFKNGISDTTIDTTGLTTKAPLINATDATTINAPKATAINAPTATITCMAVVATTVTAGSVDAGGGAVTLGSAGVAGSAGSKLITHTHQYIDASDAGATPKVTSPSLDIK